MNKDVVYPELSYRIIGNAFRVFNDVGYGLNEKYYQRAFAAVLEKEHIPFTKEQPVQLKYGDKIIGKYYLDFVIEDKIVVELKVRQKLGYVHIKQVMGYLKTTGYKGF